MQIPTPVITLIQDTGTSGTDKITANGATAVSGVLAGATVQYSINGGLTWSARFTPTEGFNSVQVRQLDWKGRASAASSALTFTLDTVAATPSLALKVDSGGSSTDRITNAGELATSGIEAGARVEYSIDGGAHWSASFAAAQGINSVQVRQIDLAGNISASSAALAFTLDTAVAAPVVALTFDTGKSDIDRVTNTGTLSLFGVESGARVEYSIDGGAHWMTNFTAAEGSNTVQVRQIDAAGNVSASSTALAFTLDTSAALLTLALANDTGGSGADRLTNSGSLRIGGVEAGAAVQYSTDGGVHWKSDFTPVEGYNAVRVRQVDVAGNVSAATGALIFTLDTQAPTAPTVALANDSGRSGADRITNDATLNVGGIETGAKVEYSIDNGAHWTAAFIAREGANSVQVRQIDAAGNVSGIAALEFVLDTAAPQIALSDLALSDDTGISATDFVTQTANQTISATLSGELADGEILSASLCWGYDDWIDITGKVSGTALNWDAVNLFGDSLMLLKVTDAAGNVAPVIEQFYRQDTQAPVASIASATVSPGDDITDIFSSEAGFAYLVNTLAVVIDLDSLNSHVASGMANVMQLVCPAMPNTCSSAGLPSGTYHLYTVDMAGNVSAAASGEVVILGQAPEMPAAFG
ncbi:MAG TPA: hypothetical protein VEC06_13575 [Paucimonas sp.]|nr:hypothetical protein [Paucimonas sp.]